MIRRWWRFECRWLQIKAGIGRAEDDFALVNGIAAELNQRPSPQDFDSLQSQVL
jgi:hypothetical protein